MRFFTRALTAEDVKDISGWRYAAPYDVYNETDVTLLPESWLMDGLHHGLCDAAGALLGFFSWKKEAQVRFADDIYNGDPDALDFGIGLRPELSGSGNGLFASACALAWLAEQFHPARFRLAVYEWNRRAQTVYKRLGFETLTRRGEFLLMTRDERPWRDASRPLENGMTVYPDDPPFDRRLYYTLTPSGWDMSVLSMTAHAGTHVDAPAHIGLPGDTDAIPFARLNGSVQLLDWRADAPVRCPRVLLRLHGHDLNPADAQHLLDAGVEMVGVDGMSVGKGEDMRTIHHMLLSAGVVILENAALEDFAPGWYEMRCLPLRIPGSDGAPVRLLLREERT